MFGSNRTEGGGKHPPSVAPGGKSPVLLGLSYRSQERVEDFPIHNASLTL